VIVRRENSDQTLNRRGTIVEWKGMSLILHANGRDREIANDEIVEVRTPWSEDYVAGVAEFSQGKTQEAVAKFQTALNSESRPWAKRIIRSHLVDAFQMLEQPVAAIEQFIQIIQEDPQTRFLHLAPLPWTGSSKALTPQAQQWIESTDPVLQLVGASWMLGGPQREQAIKVLESLTRDIDARVKNIAIAQLWRTRTDVNAKQTEVWHGIIENMPRALRAGPYFVLADAQARSGQVELAEINLMRIPILYADQKALSAAALYRAASLLHNSGKTEKAQAVLNELVTHYPQTIWAQQATQ
jgi:tetratricopeptide (TPR) repeat protein